MQESGYRYFVCYRIIPRTWFGRAKWGNVITQSNQLLAAEEQIRILEGRISDALPLKFLGCRVILVSFQLLAAVDDITEGMPEQSRKGWKKPA